MSTGDRRKSGWCSASTVSTGWPRPLRRRFERVLACKCRHVDPAANKDGILTLLAVEFEETAPPAGVVTLFFAGGPVLRLEVECLEAELADLGPSWATVAGSALAEARG